MLRCPALLFVLLSASLVAPSISGAGLFDPWFGSAYQTIPLSGLGSLAACADLNGDGRGDLVTTKAILLAQPNGQFVQSQSLTGSTYVPLVVDYDGDNDLDLVWPSGYPDTTVSLYLGNGAGTFVQIKLGVGAAPREAAVGDLNEDGYLDIAVPRTGDAITVLLGTANPSSPQSINLPTGRLPRGAGIADFNNDGHLDIVASCSQSSSSGYIALHFGDGAGGFATRVDQPSGLVGTRVFAQDFTSDGLADVVLEDDIQSVVLLTGHGDGTFATPVFFGQVSRVEAADFYPDSDWEFVTLPLQQTGTIAPTDRPRIQIYDAGARVPESVPIDFAGPLVCGDVDGDGRPDVLVNAPGKVHVFFNHGPGHWGHPQYQWLPLHSSYQGGWGFTDINGDGLIDIAAGGAEGLDVAYALPGGGFDIIPDPPGTAFSGFVTSGAFSPLNKNGDAFQDLILRTSLAPNRSIRVAWMGAGPPSYSGEVAFPANFVATGDFTGDGLDDVVGIVEEGISGQYDLSVLPGNGNGFGSEIRSLVTLGQNDPITPIAAGDLDRDGILDVVTGNGAHLGLGGGQFGSLIAFATPPAAEHERIVLADLNWDEVLDVVCGSKSGPNVYIRLGRGDGNFDFSHVISGYPYTPIAAGDLNGDGYAEIALGFGPTYVFQANPAGYWVLEGAYGGTYNGIAFADASGDGVLDLISTHSYLTNQKPIVDTFAPVAHVVRPNVGGNVAAGQPMTIDWTAKDGVGVQKVDLFLVHLPGGQATPIAEGLNARGSMEWMPGPSNTGLAKIRAVATDLSGNQAADESDMAFTITPPPTSVSDSTVAWAQLAVRVSPNPFRESGRLELDLPGPTPVRMTVHDVGGRLVQVLEDGFVATPKHSRVWRPQATAPGVYFVRVATRFGTTTRRIALLP